MSKRKAVEADALKKPDIEPGVFVPAGDKELVRVQHLEDLNEVAGVDAKRSDAVSIESFKPYEGELHQGNIVLYRVKEADLKELKSSKKGDVCAFIVSRVTADGVEGRVLGNSLEKTSVSGVTQGPGEGQYQVPPNFLG